MTRSRLAAVAALSLMVLPVTAVGGEAPGDDIDAEASCKTLHTDKRDFEKTTVEVMRRRRGAARRAGAAAVVPVKGAKVITKLKDLTTEDGSNNVVDRKDTDRTNDNGIAKTKHEFNSFGNYRLKAIVKIDGDVVATDTVKFGVFDRESGKCEPPQPT
jgi:hypothetical protein